MKITGILCVLLMVRASTSFAQLNTGDKGKFSGLVYSDFYWMAAHHDNEVEGHNGFWIRRVYFTYDREISESFSARFRLEANSPGDFITEAKLSPVVKDLYLKWQNKRHQVWAGISSTPTWGLTEDVWGYRAVEKTPLDLLNFGSSRDFGIAARGQLDRQGKLNYHFMFGNGSGNESEINTGKKIMLALSYAATDHLVFEIYGDWNDNTGDTDWLTLQGFAAWQSDNFNVGILYAHQNRSNAFDPIVAGFDGLNLDLVSIFTNFKLSETTGGFLRVDHTFDPIPGVNDNDYIPISGGAEITILIGGFDFNLNPGIHLIPNIETVIYGENPTGITPDTDFIPRLTLFYNF